MDKYNNTLDSRINNHDQNPNLYYHNQYLATDEQQYLQNNENRMYQNGRQEPDQIAQDANKYIEDYYNNRPTTRDEQDQTPEPKNNMPNAGTVNNRIAAHKQRDRSVEPRKQPKYDTSQLNRSVNIREPEPIHPYK